MLLASAAYKSKQGAKERERERGGRRARERSSSSPVEVPERLRDPPVLEREALGRGPRREHPLAVEDDRSTAAEQGLSKDLKVERESESCRTGG